jgi:hypothetical protein
MPPTVGLVKVAAHLDLHLRVDQLWNNEAQVTMRTIMIDGLHV